MNPASSAVPAKGKPTLSTSHATAANDADNAEMELADVLPSNPPPPDVMRLAQLGDEAGIRQLLDSGKIPANYADPEGITPLHWAAINNRYGVCQLLVEAGADVNAVGGESVATPAMWAAQKKHYYIVDLLTRYGADHQITDGQGYNILHLATFNGNLFLITLLLHQGINVDVKDAQGHTPLMWAAYKGYPACVELYLTWGADVGAIDDKQLTALHWALVKGNFQCIQKLIEYGSDRFHKTDTGNTPLQAAKELETLHIFQDALAECGYTNEARPKHTNAPFFLSVPESRESFLKKFLFLLPFALIWMGLMALSIMPGIISLPILIGLFLGSQWGVSQALREFGAPGQKATHKTPFLAGIFAGTAFWLGLRFLSTIFPSTYGQHPILNFGFMIMYGLCVYFYAFSMRADPGFVPLTSSREEQKETIQDLLSQWKYDERNFCVHCMVRMPLRSKHCRRCARCVARHDHHCPWIFNCVGVNNHRQFLAYVVTLEIGIILYLTLAYFHFASFPEDIPIDNCILLSASLCKPVWADPYTLYLSVWTGLQVTWVSMLLIVQTIQVLRGQTTYENMHSVNHGYDDGEVSNMVASMIAGGGTSLEGVGLGHGGAGPNPLITTPGGGAGGHHGHNHSHGHAHGRPGGMWNRILRLLGIDTFLATAKDGVGEHKHRSRRRQNPWNRGIFTNCNDFWCSGVSELFKGNPAGEAVLGGQRVDYYTMYEPPARLRRGGGGAGAYESVAADEHV
ncbi:palmitoyltransferase akr1 [Orbilia brochopaga]|uniref:Palmitoyltransferase n=1 Tax=Orbilia brochopaga TaxID=3140254 RepID=A0AAV9UFL6_9PEZI